MNEEDDAQPGEETAERAGVSAAPLAPLLPRNIHRVFPVLLAAAGVLALTAYADRNLADVLFRPPGGGAPELLPVAIGSATLFMLLLPLRPLLGHLTDTLGPLWPVAVSLLAGGVMFLVLGMAGPSWASYTGAILVGGIVAVVARIALLTMVAKLFDNHIGKAFAVVLLAVPAATFMPGLVTDLGLVFTSIVTDDFDTGRSLIAMCIGILLGVAGLAFVYVIRRWSFQQSRDDQAETLHRRSFLLFVCAMSIQTAAYWPMSLAFFNTTWTSAATILLSSLLAIPVVVGAGALSDRFDRRRVVCGVIAVQFAFAALFLTSSDILSTIGVVFVIVLGLGAAAPASLALQREYFGRRRFGLLLGIHLSALELVSSGWRLLTVAGDPILDGFDNPAFILVSTMLPLAIALLLMLFVRRPQYGNAPIETAGQAAA